MQILPSLVDLPRARKNQNAAFLASEGILVVWHDDIHELVKRAKTIETELMDLVWAAGNEDAESVDDIAKEKNAAVYGVVEVDEESGQVLPQDRATHLLNSTLVAFTLIIVVVMLGAGFRSVTVELMTDGGYLRCAFLLLTPIQIFFTLVSRGCGSGIARRNSLTIRSSLHRSSLAALRSVLVLSSK